MKPLKFKKLREDVRLPERKHLSDAGFDLYVPEATTLDFIPKIIKLGFAMELPPGHEGQIRPRSSSALHDIFVQFGTIDQDYRGEIGVIAWTRNRSITVFKGDRIAQLVVARMADVFAVEVDELSDTERGTGGFGSTGQ